MRRGSTGEGRGRGRWSRRRGSVVQFSVSVLRSPLGASSWARAVGDATVWGVGVVFALYGVGFRDKTVRGAGGDVGWAGGGRRSELGAGFGVVDGAGGAAVAGE